ECSGVDHFHCDPFAGEFLSRRQGVWYHLGDGNDGDIARSEEHTSELQSRGHLVCRLLLEKKKKIRNLKKEISAVEAKRALSARMRGMAHIINYLNETNQLRNIFF